MLNYSKTDPFILARRDNTKLCTGTYGVKPLEVKKC